MTKESRPNDTRPNHSGKVTIDVHCTFGLRSIILDLVEPFETASGHRIAFHFASTPDVKGLVENGVPADVILIAKPVADELAGAGHLDPADIHEVARSGVGIAIRAGAPRPDISTAQALTSALLAARAVVYTDPASGGASGIHFASVLEKLGIMAAMDAKCRLNVGTYNSDFVARGDADFAIQQIAEILPVKGVELLGPLPAELQLFTVFVAAIGSHGKQRAAAVELAAFMTSAAATWVIERNGMTQV